MSNPIQYMVRDPQGNVYGPATMDALKQWVREGRITAAMHLAPEGTVDWQAAAAYPELQGLFAPEQAAVVTGGLAGTPTPPNPYGTTTPVTPSYSTYTGPDTGGVPKNNGMAIAALCCGIGGFCCCVSGILGIVFGIMAKNQIKQSGGMQTGEGMATAGIVTGIISLILSVIWGIVQVVFMNNGKGI